MIKENLCKRFDKSFPVFAEQISGMASIMEFQMLI